MSTDPLSATTPLALFGADALSDARALKRAYARLIRRFKPEVAPAAFAHIRRVYEEAKAALDAGVSLIAADGDARDEAADGEAEGADDDEMPPSLAHLVEVMQLDPPPGRVWNDVMATLIATAADYGFLLQMNHFGVDVNTMEIVDIVPPDSAAAFAMGDLDIVCGWGGPLYSAKEHGNVLLTYGEKVDFDPVVFDIT